MAQCQGPSAQKRLLVFTCIWLENIVKIPMCQGPTQYKSGLGNNMVCWRNYLVCICQKQFTSTSPVFMHQNTFEKKIPTVRGMLIYQIFELRGPGSLGCICTSITGCFCHKTVSFKRAFNPNFEKLQKNLKKYVYQHNPIAILTNHPVKKV